MRSARRAVREHSPKHEHNDVAGKQAGSSQQGLYAYQQKKQYSDRDDAHHSAGQEFVLYKQAQQREVLSGNLVSLGVTSTHADPHAATAEVPHKADGIVAHASTRTTQLYDRREDRVMLDEIVKINIRG